MAETSTLNRTLDLLETDRVPRFAQALEDAVAGDTALDDLVAELVDWLGPLNTAIREHPEELTQISSLRAFRLVEWAMNCLKQHCQSVGLPAEMALVLLPIANEQLVTFSEHARLCEGGTYE